MVDVGMCQENIIDHGFLNRKIHIFVNVLPLLHTAVDQDVLAACLQIMTAACHFMGCTDKCQFHRLLPLVL